MTRYLAAALFLAAGISCASQEIEVSPTGPIRTLEAARDAVRLERSHGTKGAIKVLVHGGSYFLSDTLTLGPQDSDTEWIAAPGEHPVISGGRIISGWTKDQGKVWRAKAPGPYFRQLFIDGRRATRARIPNSGFYRIDGPSSRTEPFQLHYRGDDIKKEWATQDDVEVVAELVWSDLRMPITHLDEASRVATLSGNPAKSNHEQDARYYIENAREGLDSPGEWYFDKATSDVFYIPLPGEDMQSAMVVAASLKRLLVIHGDPQSRKAATNIRFRGLTFEHADWTLDAGGYADPQAALPAPSAIETANTDGVIFDHCTIAHSGGYGISFGRGSKHSQVITSELFDLGGGGIRIGDEALHAAADQNYGNTIADNNIHDLGLVFAGGVGVLVMQSSENEIIHNHIHDLFYTGISVGWTWGYAENQSKGTLIAFNHVHDLGKGMLSDMGGIYTLGVQPGTIVRNNLVHDIDSFTYGGWGIYTDEGSSQIRIEKNIVYNCKSAGFHQHYGRDNIIRNNIFAFNREAQLMRTKSEPHNSFTFEHNIVYFNEGALLGKDWNNSTFKMRDNVYYDSRTSSISFAGRTFSQWQAGGQDRNSVIADPLFVNGGSYNFRLKPRSPALRLGFNPIDMSTVGPRMPSGADTYQGH